ncbi:MAG TPA: hypothetical protein DCF89_05575, partial [Flavobacteriales bacterium]|nr:hypothetical protein [Flavobacteriales bacterium]
RRKPLIIARIVNFFMILLYYVNSLYKFTSIYLVCNTRAHIILRRINIKLTITVPKIENGKRINKKK